MLVGTECRAVEARVDRLVRQAGLLRRIRDEQQALVPGQVSAQESARRLAIANRVNETCQRLQLELIDAVDGASWSSELTAVRALAEEVLRENPVLLACGALQVIRSHEIAERHVLNRAGRRERRKGFGLHRHPWNDRGPSVVVAFTPPGYEQLWHAHTVDEYTLALDVRFVGRYAAGSITTLEADDGQLFHFHPHTYHTLASRGSRPGRTFTLKYPVGMSVWLPAFQLTGAEQGAAEVWSASTELHTGGVRIQRFEIRDGYHTYDLNTAHLRPDAQVELRAEQDIFVYVLDGRVEVRRGARARIASANDLIVAEPTRSLWIRALTPGTRLYWASSVALSPWQSAGATRDPRAA